MIEEVARGLGLEKKAAVCVSEEQLKRTTSLFHWEHLSECLVGLMTNHKDDAVADEDKDDLDCIGDPIAPPTPPFEWQPPDLQVGSWWFNERVRNLKRACP